jgi:Zn-finger nucleic acid-binding protein
MLIACESCHRQYDVGTLEPGQHVRCTCGVLNTVPQPREREAPVQRCSSCGGEIDDGAKACGYCEAAVQLGDRGWGDACPECFARLIKGAKFCSSCGTAIRPQVISKSPRSEVCPRCEATLAMCEIPGGSFVECTGCGGVWLEEKVFEGLTEHQETKSAVASYFAGPKKAPQAEGSDTAGPVTKRFEDVKYLKCPMCANMMNRKNFATCSGVIIDWCKGHGFWFDAHELEQIMAFVSSGGLEKSRRREIHESKRQTKLAREKANQARLAAGGTGAGGGLGMGGGWGTPSHGPSIVHLLAGLLRGILS